jgi:sucrose phosphorylase
MVRLDAVGYAIKKAGSSCFMIPETFAFIEALANQAAALGIEVLVEIHSYFRRQIEIANQVDRVYDFALPPLVLHAIFNHTARYLKQWLEISPRNAITVLDTHDGIGVIDIGADSTDPQNRPGMIPPKEWMPWYEKIHTNSNGQSRQATGKRHPILICTRSTAHFMMPWAVMIMIICWHVQFNSLLLACHKYIM